MTTRYACNFEHWHWEVPEEVLRRYISPHFSRSDAGAALVKLVRDRSVGAKRVTSQVHQIPAIAILAGNEAYPETAIADPISDLLVWHDWESGRRRFPYPGVYAPLDLKDQGQKIAATSVIGVFGEILTGLYSQAGIGLSPTARVIRKWPDFIFQRSQTFHFIEAKAVLDEWVPGAPLSAIGKHKANLREVLIEALQQFGAEPWVTVWGGFIGIDIDQSLDIRFTATLLELHAPQVRKNATKRATPAVVAQELAKRVLARALARIAEYDSVWQIESKRQRKSRLNPALKAEVPKMCYTELRTLLEAESLEDDGIILDVEQELNDLIARLEPAVGRKASRTDRLRSRARNEPLQIRTIGENVLVTIPLSDREQREFGGEWTGEWNRIESTVTRCGHAFCRAGGSLFGLVPLEEAHSFPKQV